MFKQTLHLILTPAGIENCGSHRSSSVYDEVWCFPGGSDGKEFTCSERDLGSIPGLGRFPGENNGNPLQSSCLENSMDRVGYSPWGHKVSDMTEWLSLYNPIHPLQVENTVKSKIRLIWLRYWTSWLDMAYLKCAQNTSAGLELGKSIEYKPCLIEKSWVSHLMAWILYWKWQNRGALWVWNGCECVSCSPSWSTPSGLPGSWGCPAQKHQRGLYLKGSPKKGSKSQVYFLLNAYRFHIIIMVKILSQKVKDHLHC